MHINSISKAEWFTFLKKTKETHTDVSENMSLVPLTTLNEQNISFVPVQLHDHYTRDHIHGDNSLAGWVFVPLHDGILCHEVYGAPGGYRSFNHIQSLLLDTTPEELNERLYRLVSSEIDDEYINGMKNDNDNETIKMIIRQLFPTMAS